jgi:hypothetical protein
MTVRLRIVLLATSVVIAMGGCRDLEVVTESYATLSEAVAAGAIDRGWVPRGLPSGTRELREAHDRESSRRWGLFNFPHGEGPALRALLGAERSLAGTRCDPPRRIEWWPILLRGALDDERLRATGLQTYESRDAVFIFAVNWSQGRAYYWSK